MLASDKQLAVWFCLSCESSLCATCKDSLHTGKVFSKHAIVPVSQRPKVVPMCAVHSKPIEVYCNTDKVRYRGSDLHCYRSTMMINDVVGSSQEAICHFCHLYGNHKGHDAVLLEVHVASQLKEVEALQHAVTNVLQAASDRSVALRSAMVCNDEWLRSAQEQLRRAGQSIKSDLESKLAVCDNALRQRHQVQCMRCRYISL